MPSVQWVSVQPIDRACERFHEGLSRNDVASENSTARLRAIDSVLNRAETGSREVKALAQRVAVPST